MNEREVIRQGLTLCRSCAGDISRRGSGRDGCGQGRLLLAAGCAV